MNSKLNQISYSSYNERRKIILTIKEKLDMIDRLENAESPKKLAGDIKNKK